MSTPSPRRVATTLLFVAMELACLLPSAGLVRAVAGYGMPGLLTGLAATYLAGTAIGAAWEAWTGGIDRRLRAGLLVAAGGLSLAVLTATMAPAGIGPALLPLILGSVVWARGVAVGTRPPGFRAFAYGFQTGLVLLSIALAIAGLAAIPLPAATASAAVFLASGLVGLGWTRRATASSGRSTFAGSGLAMPLAAAGVVVVLGLAVWSLLDRSVVDLLIAGVMWIARQLYALLAWLVSLFPEPEPFEAPGPAVPAPASPQGGAPQGRALPDWVRTVANWMMILGTAYVVGSILISYLRELLAWLGRRARPTTALARERAGGPLADIRTLFAWLRRRLARLAARFGRGSDETSVRGLYRALLGWAAAHDVARTPAETPAAHAARLARAVPAHGHDVAAIAAAYMPVRYGARDEPAADLPALRERWRRIAADPRPSRPGNDS